MRRRGGPHAVLPNALAGAVICMALVASLATPEAAPAPPSSRAAARVRTTSVGVGLREYRIALYRSRVLPGRVRFNVENLGEDGHDLRVIGASGTRTIRGSSPELRPGVRRTLTVTLLKRGVYTLVCTLADHESRGMVSRLRVVRKL